MQIEVHSGKDRCRISLVLHCTAGRGLCGFLTGGTAHVGAVAYAVPRPKSSGDGITADISSICGPGHKDIYAAQKVAEQICLKVQETVCICAGIHIDHASQDEIQQIMTRCLEAADQAVDQYSALQEENHV